MLAISVRCLKNVRNVVQFNICDVSRAIALRPVTSIEPDSTMKLSRVRSLDIVLAIRTCKLI